MKLKGSSMIKPNSWKDLLLCQNEKKRTSGTGDKTILIKIYDR